MRFNKAYVEITNVCNLNCSFCHGTSRTQRFMTADEFDLVTDRLKGYTEYLYYHLMGEPLLHPELPELLNVAASKCFNSIITTNGTLLASSGDDILTSDRLKKVNISLQAFEGNALNDLQEYLSSCAGFAYEASRRGVICVFRLWNVNGAERMNHDIVSALRTDFTNEWTKTYNGFKLMDRVYLEFAETFSWPDIEIDEISCTGYCYGLKDQIGILCDGTIVPCCLDSEGIIALGNIYETELSEILSSDRAAAITEGFRNRRPAEELCRKCGYSRRFDK